MTEIRKEPHLLFSAYWVLWILSSVPVAFADSMTAWYIWLGAFLAVELPASFIDTGKRDTLSEIATWVQRKLSKHRIFAKGWNAFILLIIDIIGATGTRPLWQDFRPIVYVMQSAIILTLLVLWLYPHWVSPDENG